MIPRISEFRSVSLIVLMAFVLLNSGGMPGIEAAGYTISGRVTDSFGNPIQGVTITATPEIETPNRIYLPMVMQNNIQGVSAETPFGSDPLTVVEGVVKTVLRKEILANKPGLLRLDNRAGAEGAQAASTYIAITDANGNYLLDNLPAGKYTLTPSLTGHSFIPLSLTVNVPPNATGQDFKTNQSPTIPFNPSPAAGALGQSIAATLGWTGGDPDGDTVTYDVYFAAGDSTPDALVCDDAPSVTCNPGALSYSTQYYWQVIARDEHGATTTGPVWDFTTETAPIPDLFDSVLYMTQVSGYTSIPDNASLVLGRSPTADFTIDAYFYVPDLDFNSPRTIVRKHNTFEVWFYFHNDQPDRISFEIPLPGIGTIFLNYDTNLQVGWHHMAIVFDNEYTESEDAMVIFLDGTRVAFSPDGAYHPDWVSGLPPSGNVLEIGGVTNGNVGFYGYLEEIRISDVVRYSGSTYTQPTGPFTSDANTVALWHFDEPAGTTYFEDASSYNNDLAGYLGAQTYSP